MPTFPCPTCEDVFDTRRGLGVHHSVQHDERLPNRTCSECGDEFYSSYEKRYCSPDCLDAGVSYEGMNNPNYRGSKEQSRCRLCGSAFEYYPSEKPGMYCPACLETEQWRSVPAPTGNAHHRWAGGRQEYDCTVCGDPVERYPSEITGDAVLCGTRCRRTWLSETFSGENHPNWKGGGNEPYGTGWNAVRARALERDAYTCVICSKTKDQIGRNPDVHHIVPVRSFIESARHEKEDAHTLENVVSLCIDCHRKADFGRISPARLRFLIGAPVGRTA